MAPTRPQGSALTPDVIDVSSGPLASEEHFGSHCGENVS